MTGNVSNIQRYSVNDGYGLRTIVFLLGCNMRCAWCQNPEAIGIHPGLMFIADTCANCGACLPVCSTGACVLRDNEVYVYREKCRACFRCVDVCYFNARKPSGKTMTVEETFQEVMKDEAFFRSSGGGLTLSGGEPLLQAEFCRMLLRRAKEAGIGTAIETAGNVAFAAFEEVLAYTDLFLCDVKLMEEEKHKKWTGVSNRTILENLRALAETGKEVIIRVPLIPDVNDGAEFDAIAAFAASLPGVRELHILPYHTLGESKYDQLGMAYQMQGFREENDPEIERCRLTAEQKGLRVSVGGAGFAARP